VKKINWSVVVIVGLLIALFLFATGMFGGWGYGNYGYRGWSMMGPGMMGGWGYSPFGWIGWIGMLFMGLIPLGFIVLTVLGVAWLVKNIGNSAPPLVQSPCPHCGKGTQADWQTCPYCGTALK